MHSSRRLALTVFAGLLVCTSGSAPASDNVAATDTSVVAVPAVPDAAPLVMMYYNPCKDLCPVYGVMFYRDGSARYNGVERIPWPGNWYGTASLDTLAAIEVALKHADLFSITDTYSHSQRQTPASYIEYFGEDGRSVKQRVGSEKTPELNALEKRLHEVVKAMEWAPVPNPETPESDTPETQSGDME